MKTVVVDVSQEGSVELESVDVGVADEVLSFDITGTVRVGGDGLASVEGQSLRPVEVVFEVV